jgi:hypothetical protein
VSIFAIVLLVAAVVLIGAAEWARLAKVHDLRAQRKRDRRKSRLRVVSSEKDEDDFARSVERDLAALPTIDEHEPRR